MKIWQKIMASGLVVFTVLYNVGGTIQVINNHKLNLQREIESSLREYDLITLAVQSDLSTVALRLGNRDYMTQDIIAQTIANTMSYYRSANTHGLVETRQAVVYSDQPPEEGLAALLAAGDDPQRSYYAIFGDDGSEQLALMKWFRFQDTDYRFVLTRDISPVYRLRDTLTRLFLVLGLLMTVLAGVSMYFVSRLITRSLRTLSLSAQRIAEGDYHSRAELSSTDETGALALNFNCMADAVENRISELNERNARQQRFIQSFTHEVKTPLTSIIGYANALRTGAGGAEAREQAVEYIYTEGLRLNRLSKKMVDLVLLDQAELKLRPFAAQDILEAVRLTVQPRLEQANLTLAVAPAEVTFVCDMDLMIVLLTNLLDNAILASQPGGSIELFASREGDQAVITVADHGVGMEQEELQRITEPFYRVDKSRSREAGGMGLGLAICKVIAQVHGADLRFASEKGVGTTVSVRFPAHAAAADDLTTP